MAMRYIGTKDELIAYLDELASAARNRSRSMSGAAKGKEEGMADGLSSARHLLENWTEPVEIPLMAADGGPHETPPPWEHAT